MTTDLVILTLRKGQLCVLLVRRPRAPFLGQWSLPGGFVGPDEAIEAAARRKLGVKTGVDAATVHLEQLQTYGDPARDPRMRVVSVAYVAFAANLPEAVQGEPEEGEARWWPVTEALGEELAFDHAQVLEDGVERARAKLEYTTLALSFCPAEFTLAQLRAVYEIVWGQPLDAPNFRRKVLAAEDFVVATGGTVQPAKGRPAALYRAGAATDLQPPFRRP